MTCDVAAAKVTYREALLQKPLQLACIPSGEVYMLAHMGKALPNSPVAGLPEQQG
jgi:hypothetical protein